MAVAGALAVSVTVSALTGAGRGDDAPRAAAGGGTAPSSTVASASPAVTRALGRLRVDVAVARATWEGRSREAGDDSDLVTLLRAVEAAERWLADHEPLPAGADEDRVLEEVAAHRDVLTALTAQVRATPTPTPEPTATPRATQRATPARPAPARRPSTSRPAATPSATAEPTAAPGEEPTTVPTPDVPAPEEGATPPEVTPDPPSDPPVTQEPEPEHPSPAE